MSGHKRSGSIALGGQQDIIETSDLEAFLVRLFHARNCLSY